MVWSGLGVNYKSIDVTRQDWDIAYFNKIGLHYIRVQIPSYTEGDTEITYWRNTATKFYNAGFHVLWGLTGDPLTSANWNTYANAVKSEALTCQNNNVCTEYEIGNELELHHDGTLTDANIRDNLRTLATEVQAIFIKGSISYAVSQGVSVNGWVSDNDIGNLDNLSVNTYGYANSGVNFNPAYVTTIQAYLQAAFANKIYISEFNLDYNATRCAAIDANFDLSTIEMNKYLNYIKGTIIPRAYIYQYCGYKDRDTNDFQMVFSDRNTNTPPHFRQKWNAIVNNNKRTSFIEV